MNKKILVPLSLGVLATALVVAIVHISTPRSEEVISTSDGLTIKTIPASKESTTADSDNRTVEPKPIRRKNTPELRDLFVPGDGILRGRVFDQDGEPVSGAQIGWFEIQRMAGGSHVGRIDLNLRGKNNDMTVSNSSGTFELAMPGSGILGLWAVKNEYLLSVSAGLKPVSSFKLGSVDGTKMEFHLNPSSELEGEVVDRKKSPISFAQVRARSSFSVNHVSIQAHWTGRRTDEEGRFRICGFTTAPTGLHVIAQEKGYTTGITSLASLRRCKTIVLSKIPSLRGFVWEHEKSTPIGNFIVLVMDKDKVIKVKPHFQGGETKSGLRNFFLVPGVPKVPLDVAVYCPGHVPHSEKFEPGDQLSSSVREYRLRKGGERSISGVLMNPSGRPWGKAEIRCYPMTILDRVLPLAGDRRGMRWPLGEECFSIRTDGAGRFEMKGLPKGEYLLTTGAKAKAIICEIVEIPVDLGRISSSRPASLEGRLEVDGKAMKGCRVLAEREDGLFWSQTVTDERGGYCFKNLPPGCWTVRPQSRSGRENLPLSPEIVEIRGDEGVQLNFRGASKEALGEVRFSLQPDTPVLWTETSGIIEPFAGVTPFNYFFRKRPEDPPYRFVNPGTNEIQARLKHGTYLVEAREKGKNCGWAFKVSVQEYGEVNGTVHLSRGSCSVEGIVTNERKRPLPGKVVLAIREKLEETEVMEAMRVARADRKGAYKIDGLSVGMYTIRVIDPPSGLTASQYANWGRFYHPPMETKLNVETAKNVLDFAIPWLAPDDIRSARYDKRQEYRIEGKINGLSDGSRECHVKSFLVRNVDGKKFLIERPHRIRCWNGKFTFHVGQASSLAVRVFKREMLLFEREFNVSDENPRVELVFDAKSPAGGKR